MKKNVIVVTNYKAMYSLLASQENLSKVLFGPKLHLQVGLKKISISHLRFYMITRNPYDRTASFFRDKFRKSILTMASEDEWQNCQRIFFKHLSIDQQSSFAEKKEKFIQTSFSNFLEVLPLVYLSDPHLVPQYLILHQRSQFMWLKIVNRISIDWVCRMESYQDLNMLANDLSLKIERKFNDTSDYYYDTLWRDDDRNIISNLYKMDFHYFNYVH